MQTQWCKLIFCALFLPLASCASGVKERVAQAEEDAPTWYETRKKEVIDRGYLDFKEVPTSENTDQVDKDTISADEQLEQEIELLKTNPKAQTAAAEGREDPAKWAKRVREEIEEGFKQD